MNLLIDPGMLPVQRLSNSFDDFSKENNLFIISKHTQSVGYKEVSKRFSVFRYDDFFNGSENFNIDEINLQYSEVLKVILNDHRTILLAERVGYLKKWNSVHNSQKEIEKLIFKIIDFLKQNDINVIMFQATPHSLIEWLLGKTATVLKIKVLMIQTSPIPWRYWLINGIDAQETFNFLPERINTFDSFLEGFIETNLSDYSKAIPDYEKKRIESRKGRFWSWKKELIDIVKKPHKRSFNNLIYKRRLYIKYKSLCTDLHKIKTNSIVFLLHYQPERTSLPEGRLYSQQWLIIRHLSLCLPQDWTLYIKEHPSTFTGKFVPTYRDFKFYEDISKLKNVDLVSLDTDTFHLIDNSRCIATITGTVGVQALIRGKPVLAFGRPSYKSAYGAFVINDIHDLQVALDSIKHMEKDDIKNKTRIYLENCVKETISTDNITCNKKEFNYYHPTNRIEGHISLINLFLSSHNKQP